MVNNQMEQKAVALTVDPLNKANEADIRHGAALHAAFVTNWEPGKNWEPGDRVEDYSITDAIVALMHFAAHKGFDVEGIIRSAQGHFEAETTECEACGKLEDPAMHDCEAEQYGKDGGCGYCGRDTTDCICGGAKK